MARLRVRHRTGFAYRGEVTASYNEARMLPSTGEGQFVLSAALEIRPMSSSHGYTDYWGTRVNSFEILSPHDSLTLTATSLVEVRRAEQAHERAGWDELQRATAAAVGTVEQLQQTRLTSPPAEVAALAADAASGADPCAAALAVAKAVHERVTYLQGVTNVHTTAADAWRQGRGVCQDIAHITIGALRSAGIPARYVSGYLHPDPSGTIGRTVRGESHAWVEWFCGAWTGWDPTNDIPVGDRHVQVGHGRDYDDVPPLRGVYAGPSGSEVFVEVEITRES